MIEIDRQLEHGIEIGEPRRQNQEREADRRDDREPGDVERAGVQMPLRKKRPVMPCGSRRMRTIAAASSATSPNTGVVA